jgi:hypothetical protein
MIHEALYYAVWSALLASAIAFTVGVPSILQAALLIVLSCTFIMWLLMPPVPTKRVRRRKRRKSSHWMF